MKSTLLLLFLLSSCSFKKDKLQGEWILLEYRDVFFSDQLKFADHLLEVTDRYGQKVSYKFFADMDSVYFHEKKLAYNFEGDDLVIGGAVYTNDSNKSERILPLLDLSLPKFPAKSIESLSFFDRKGLSELLSFGKDKKSGEFVVQVNDVIIPKSEISEWIKGFENSKIPIWLAIDKSAKMGEVDSIFYQIRKTHNRKLIFLSSDSLWHYGRTTKATQEYSRPFIAGEADGISPPAWYPFYQISPKMKRNLMRFRKGKIFLNSVEIQVEKVKEIVAEKLSEEPSKICIFVYEAETSYGNYMRAKAQVYEAYELVRNEISQTFYGKNYNELEAEKATVIREKLPRQFIDMNAVLWEKQLEMAYN